MSKNSPETNVLMSNVYSYDNLFNFWSGFLLPGNQMTLIISIMKSHRGLKGRRELRLTFTGRPGRGRAQALPHRGECKRECKGAL